MSDQEFEKIIYSKVMDDVNPIHHVQLSSTGYLLVALEDTRANALRGSNLKAVLSQYNVEFDGLALHVWDKDTESWVKLTKDMLAS